MPTKNAIYIVLALISLASQGFGQENLDINLIPDYSSAEQMIALYEDQFVNTENLVSLRGNRIAASTTGLIGDNLAASGKLRDYIDSLRFHQIIRDDIYQMESARRNAPQMKDLLLEIQRRNLSNRVTATVKQIFPADADFTVTIPVYFVALGHENVDAFVRRIVWHGDVPEFAGEGTGEVTIVINLAHSVSYGADTEERFVTLLGVLAHEVFHAAFSVYTEKSAAWEHFRSRYRTPFFELLDLAQNEGIAYYLSLEQSWRGRLPRDWPERTREALSTFNQGAEELLSRSTPAYRASEILRKANLRGYWESFGSIAGMFIAREIDQRLGREILIETIAKGPLDFFRKYISITETDSNLPKLDKDVIMKIPKKRLKN